MTGSAVERRTVWSHLDIRRNCETLIGTLSRIVVRPAVVIAGADTKIVDGRLTDEPTLRFAREAVGDLVTEIGLGAG